MTLESGPASGPFSVSVEPQPMGNYSTRSERSNSSGLLLA